MYNKPANQLTYEYRNTCTDIRQIIKRISQKCDGSLKKLKVYLYKPFDLYKVKIYKKLKMKEREIKKNL